VSRPAPRAVVFDMDGVLIDSGAHHRDAWAALLSEIGVVPRNGFWRLTIGRPAEEAVALLVPGVDGAEARRLADRKRAHYEQFCRRGMLPVRGVPAFVERLARASVPLAVATSAVRHDLERVLTALGLRGHFPVVVTADDVRWGKPHPDVYLRAAAGLDVDPAACLVFEDSVVGVQAARTADMRVVGVTTAHEAGELVAAGAERTIADFEGLSWPV
jgi:HAD superfamily hydrolase (TIGR01509 family)